MSGYVFESGGGSETQGRESEIQPLSDIVESFEGQGHFDAEPVQPSTPILPTTKYISYDHIKLGMLMYLSGGPVVHLVKTLLHGSHLLPESTFDAYRFPSIVIHKDENVRTGEKTFSAVPFVEEDVIRELCRLQTTGDVASESDGYEEREEDGEEGRGFGLKGLVNDEYLRCFIRVEEDSRACGGWALLPMAIACKEKTPDGMLLTYEWKTGCQFSEISAQALYEASDSEVYDMEMRMRFIDTMQDSHE